MTDFPNPCIMCANVFCICPLIHKLKVCRHNTLVKQCMVCKPYHQSHDSIKKCAHGKRIADCRICEENRCEHGRYKYGCRECPKNAKKRCRSTKIAMGICQHCKALTAKEQQTKREMLDSARPIQGFVPKKRKITQDDADCLSPTSKTTMPEYAQTHLDQVRQCEQESTQAPSGFGFAGFVGDAVANVIGSVGQVMGLSPPLHTPTASRTNESQDSSPDSSFLRSFLHRLLRQ